MSHATFVACIVLFSATQSASGSGFLKLTSSASRISKEEVQISLLEEIESSLGTGSAAKKIHQLEAQLAPMYAALPKNDHGGLSPPVVRYALHRLFVFRHGWFVKGLDPAGGSFNDSSPSGMLKDQVPAYIQGLFEKRLDGKGLGLHELAVFAATIEHLIHNEAVGRLGDALKVHDILPTSPLTEAEADGVLDTYIMAYIIGENLTNMTLDDAKDLHAEMPELYLAWNETKQFMRNMRQNISASTGVHEINFATLVKVAETAGEHFGSFQDGECKGLKRNLVAMEHRGSGRVRLSDFYKPALNGGAWQFQESASYLRELGLLDETDAATPKVVIPNYLLSPSNCIASSSYYSVCCMDECEALLAHIESGVAAPEAAPERISSLVADLPSSSVSAPRELPDSLIQRLNEIAAAHDGTVPIHGRLFAQWMHHAFPRECPYPHLSGTTKPQTADEWMADKGHEPTATVGEMLKYTSVSKQSKSPQTVDSKEVEMPWSHAEELLVVRPPAPAKVAQPSGYVSFRSFMLLLSIGSAALALVRTIKSTSSAAVYGTEKQLV
mmetsp:Transcript_142659/g.251847  ORF Transcript_142659/g.251847 Transcript_142659/m.251847 type:complete len:555 (-) Transcript_142659:71-1735(-)